MDLVSAPVVDDETNKLLGRITIDDVVDVIQEQAEHALLQLQGLDEDEDCSHRLGAPLADEAFGLASI